MVKAIFFDVDGTLLSRKYPRMKGSLKRALQSLRRQGVYLFLATGRHKIEIEELKLIEDFMFDGYVTLNGCYCYTNDEVVHQVTITKEDIQNIVQVIEKDDTACMFVEADKMYINKVNERVIEAQKAIHTPVPNVEGIEQALEHDIYQIIPYITEEESNRLIAKTSNCKATKWHELAYDIIPSNGGKNQGIEKMLRHHNIDLKDTMAFGDGHNDMDMLRYVQTGICMGNGDQEVKEISDFVTKNVDDDGIIYALQHFDLLSK